MEDFKIIVHYVLSLLSIEIPVLGYRFSIFSLFLGFFVLSLVINVVVRLFGGDS